VILALMKKKERQNTRVVASIMHFSFLPGFSFFFVLCSYHPFTPTGIIVVTSSSSIALAKSQTSTLIRTNVVPHYLTTTSVIFSRNKGAPWSLNFEIT
jgi:hypothetical protein